MTVWPHPRCYAFQPGAWRHRARNYIKSLFAVGFRAADPCGTAIYAVLIQGIATGGDPIGAIWGTVGYTVLLAHALRPGALPSVSWRSLTGGGAYREDGADGTLMEWKNAGEFIY